MFLITKVHSLSIDELMFLPGISRAGQTRQTGFPPSINTEEKIFQVPGWTVGAKALRQ